MMLKRVSGVSLNLWFVNLVMICIVNLTSCEPLKVPDENNYEVLVPKISITNTFGNRRIECHGPKLISMYFIPCGTINECYQKEICFITNKTIERCSGLLNGQHCDVGPNGKSPKISVKNGVDCFKINFPIQFVSGMIVCRMLPASKSDRFLEILDYIFQVVPGSNDYTLLSTDQSSLFQMNFQVEHKNKENVKNEVDSRNIFLYTNEELTIQCSVPPFVFFPKSVRIKVIKSNGRTLNIDPELYDSDDWSDNSDWKSRLNKFRVYKDIVGFRCEASLPENVDHTHSHSSVDWLFKDINVTVQDPPLKATSTSFNGSLIEIANKFLGCNLTGNYIQVFRNRQNISLHFNLQDKVIRTLIGFLRFQELTDNKFICFELMDENDWRNQNTKFDYFIDAVFHGKKHNYFPANTTQYNRIEINKMFTVNFFLDEAVRKPEIEKLIERRFKGHEHPGTLKCKFHGEPVPYIIWLRNGQEYLYTFGKKGSNHGSSDPKQWKWIEESLLPLSLVDLDELNHGQQIVYTCLASNFLGNGSLNFVLGDGPSNNGHLSDENDGQRSGQDDRQRSGQDDGQRSGQDGGLRGSDSMHHSGFLIPLLLSMLGLGIGIGILGKKYYKTFKGIERRSRGIGHDNEIDVCDRRILVEMNQINRFTQMESNMESDQEIQLEINGQPPPYTSLTNPHYSDSIYKQLSCHLEYSLEYR